MKAAPLKKEKDLRHFKLDLQVEKLRKREKLLKLLMEAQILIEKELTPDDVAKTLRHYDLSQLQLALLPQRVKLKKLEEDLYGNI